eukprot:6191471-Pleurochrysis_carterae.AAC.4
MASVGQCVWLPVDDDEAYALARVKAVQGDSVLLERVKPPRGAKKEETLLQKAFEALSVVSGSEGETCDLVQLEDVSFAAMLSALRARSQRDEIFTSVGPVLVVVNPYKPVACCSPDLIRKMGAGESMPPHTHSIVATAYRNLLDEGGAQSVLVSGESGAGKTESIKLCMTSLAQLSRSSGKITAAALESSLLLEASACARTRVHTRARTCARAHTHSLIRARTPTHARIRACARTRAPTHALTVQERICANATCAHARTRARAHASMHASTHGHARTHARVRPPACARTHARRHAFSRPRARTAPPTACNECLHAKQPRPIKALVLASHSFSA